MNTSREDAGPYRQYDTFLCTPFSLIHILKKYFLTVFLNVTICNIQQMKNMTRLQEKKPACETRY